MNGCSVKIKPEPYSVTLTICETHTGKELAWIELYPSAMGAISKILANERRRAAWRIAKDRAAAWFDVFW